MKWLLPLPKLPCRYAALLVRPSMAARIMPERVVERPHQLRRDDVGGNRLIGSSLRPRSTGGRSRPSELDPAIR